MIDLEKLTIQSAHAHLESGDFSALDLAKAYLDEIQKKDGELNAYLEVFDDVIEQAKAVQKRIEEGGSHVLTGIPMAIKDNFLIHGRKASSGSKILENFTAPYDATVISKLKAAGAVFLGRTNMDEFAMGASTETSAFGVTRNPHDPTRAPGGSSGGSAAAVSANMALAALGSDTGGSVRQPASFCGVVGLKPTYGAISRFGLMAMASSLDHVGPITKSVDDARLMFDALSGRDNFDSTSIEYDEIASSSVKEKLTIGVPTAFAESEGIHPAVVENFRQTKENLKGMGLLIKEVSLPNIKYSLPVYYIIVPAEASTNLARYDGVKYGLHVDGRDVIEDYFLTRGAGFGKEVRRRIMIGAYVLSSGYHEAYYNKANQVRALIRKDFEDAFEEVDIIMMPTAPTPAFKIGEKIDDPIQMYLADIFTAPADITGMPAISIPSGFAELEGKRLPLGIQFIASYKKEGNLFKIGKDFFGK